MTSLLWFVVKVFSVGHSAYPPQLYAMGLGNVQTTLMRKIVLNALRTHSDAAVETSVCQELISAMVKPTASTAVMRETAADKPELKAFAKVESSNV